MFEGDIDHALAPDPPVVVVGGVVEQDYSGSPVMEQLHILEGEDRMGACGWCGQGVFIV